MRTGTVFLKKTDISYGGYNHHRREKERVNGRLYPKCLSKSRSKPNSKASHRKTDFPVSCPVDENVWLCSSDR